MTAEVPGDEPALAVSGSNVTGDVPFSCALRLHGAVHVALPPAGNRADLALLAADLCSVHGTRPEDLRELRTDLGPGSYTGLRVAVTFVRFLQHFGSVRVRAADSFACLATALPAAASPRVQVLLDARRQRLHVAPMRRDEHGVWWHEGTPISRTRDELLATAFHACFATNAAVDDQLGDALRDRGAIVHVLHRLDASILFDARLRLEACTSEQLEPRYLTGSYAD